MQQRVLLHFSRCLSTLSASLPVKLTFKQESGVHASVLGGSSGFGSSSLRLQFQRCFQSSSSVWSADYYDILGIPHTATDKDIKRAYHQKAMELHPDRNKVGSSTNAVDDYSIQKDPKAQEKFQEIHKAYTTLSNKEKRRIYDQVGGENYERMESGGGDASAGFQGEPHPDFEKIINEFNKAFGGGVFGFNFGMGGEMHDFFRGGGFSRMAMQEIRLSFMEAAKGTKKSLRISMVPHPVEVDFPAGIDSGQQIVVKADDSHRIILTVIVEQHPLFQRHGLDIYTTTKIDLVDAALGGQSQIPTLDGDSEIKFTKGTQHGDRLRLKGKGIRAPRQKGDMYVIINVVVPTQLTNKQRQLLLEFSIEERTKKAA